jgi:hypothetical protein
MGDGADGFRPPIALERILKEFRTANSTQFSITYSVMRSLTHLNVLALKFAAAVCNLNLDGGEQRSVGPCSSVAEPDTSQRSEAIGKQCLAYFARFESRAV